MNVVLKWYKKYHGTRDLYLEFFGVLIPENNQWYAAKISYGSIFLSLIEDLSKILTMGMINLWGGKKFKKLEKWTSWRSKNN